MRKRSWLVLVPATYLFVAACVGDDPGVEGPGGTDGGPGADGTGQGGGQDGSLVDDAATTEKDGGGDAGPPPCGYPGETCCAAPLAPCKEGTTCGTSNNKCMVSEVVAVGTYVEANSATSTFTEHLASFRYDGKSWSLMRELITQNPLSSRFSPTSVVAGSSGIYYGTFFKSAEGWLLEFSASHQRDCKPGQACAGPTTPQPAFWSVAHIGNENWIGATNAIYRCAANPCTKEVTGLESTTWGTGTITGTSNKDIWYSALTRAFHFDGTKWTIHENLKARTLFQVRENDVWVGDQTLQHWDGQKWSDEYVIDGSPAPGIITSISGSSSNDIWAVGYDGTTGAHPAFSAHWDGVSWTKKPLPADTAEDPSVYAPSPLEAFMASATGLYRWDGAKWEKMTAPTVNAGPDGSQPRFDVLTGPARPRP